MGQYYRHKPGVPCGSGKTMVVREVYEDDFFRLIKLFEVKPESFDLLMQLSTHLHASTEDDEDLETKKQEGTTLCRRKIEASIALYGDGRISREEYVRRVEFNEREIASWQAKTTDKEKLALELSMCIQAVDALTRMWEIVSDEDKQGMARHLFEYITYDLGTRQIVDFRLKPWADQFLTLRAGLYAEELLQADGNPVVPTGLDIIRLPLAEIVEWLLTASGLKQATHYTRDELIRMRHEAGERLSNLAREFDISPQRAYQIVRHK